MTVTAQQIAYLSYGDVITLTGHDEPGVTTTGPVSEGAGGSYWLGARIHLGDFAAVNLPGWARRDEATLTVVSRAPRPLYVNHPRTEPVPGDVVRDEDGEGIDVWMFADPDDPGYDWRVGDPTSDRHQAAWSGRDSLPTRLRLLVDGETGQVVQ